ncbi:EndoU domain-containing protein, partial [Listeria monocytogenes]
DTTIYDFAAYSKVKQGGMWILSKDGKVDIKATEAYNTASFNGELPKENNQATEEGELLKATLESLKQNKDPITGHEISKAQSFGILTSLVFGYTTKKYRGKKLTIQRSTLSNMNRTIKSKSIITSEIEEKILWGQRKNLNKNEIIGGHSSNINNRHSNYAVEIVKINPDGTKEVRFTTQFPDGNLAKIKKSTIFPDDWSDNQILDRVKNIGDSSPIRVRERDGASLHRAIIEGVEIDVIKLGDNIISGYPTGQVNAPFPGGFTK